jgi:hypothetical protein
MEARIIVCVREAGLPAGYTWIGWTTKNGSAEISDQISGLEKRVAISHVHMDSVGEYVVLESLEEYVGSQYDDVCALHSHGCIRCRRTRRHSSESKQQQYQGS